LQNQLLTQNLFNMKTQNPKFLILLICLLAFSLNAVAQEIIQFKVTVTSDDDVKFFIRTTLGKQFTVNWGDDSDIELFTGEGEDFNWQEIRHYYDKAGDYAVNIAGNTNDCLFIELSILNLKPYCWLTHLDVSKSPSLRVLACINHKLYTLDLRNNAALTSLYCAYDFNLNTLNLTNNMALAKLQCMNNQLCNLDLGNNNSLKVVECQNNLLSDLNVSNNNALTGLNCENNKLTNLSVSNNNKLNVLICQNNKLSLLNLYEISKTIKPDIESGIVFGEQRLNSQAIEVGEYVDFSSQKEFGGFATVFTVEKDSLPALDSDYTITGGFITFHTEGKYQVSMANSAITVMGWFIPAKVIAEINVGNVSIPEITKEELRIKVYPNPTTGELRIANYELRVNNIEIFDVYGRKILSHTSLLSSAATINISHFPTGIYFVKIYTEQGVITKKVIKN